jgi:hypothetical protein
MNKKKLAGIIVACTIAIIVVIVLVIPTRTPLKITRVEKTSVTLYYQSYQDFQLSWTIKGSIQNDGDDVEAGRARLVVSLYDTNGRYDTKQIDDLGPLTSGWDADFQVNFLINQEYGTEGEYAEVTLYLDGKGVDKAVVHF